MNQDRALVQSHRTTGEFDTWHGRIPSLHSWAAVADGMGGHEAGNIASDVTIEAVARGIPAVTTEEEFADLSRAANRRIFEAMHTGEGRPRMGSTLVAATIQPGYALVANVGDSRAYHLSEGRLYQLSADHTLKVRKSSRRHHALTQSLGGLTYEVPIIPHIIRVNLSPSDSLLLCSDGLTDMIDDADIEELLAEHSQEPATALVQAALGAGGRDNITVILIGPTEAD